MLEGVMARRASRINFNLVNRSLGRGFTIVELLIVIVVIGVLAAITIVAFSGVQTRARDARVMSELKSLQTSMEMFVTDNGRKPTNAGAGNNTHPEIGTVLRGANLFASTRDGADESRRYAFCLSPERTEYAVVAYLGSRDEPVFYVTRQSGVKEGVFYEWLVGESVAANLCAVASGEFMNSADWIRGSPPWAIWAAHAV